MFSIFSVNLGRLFIIIILKNKINEYNLKTGNNMKLKNKETILFFGDSITDSNRRDIHAPLGNGFVKLFDDMLTIRRPENKITVINKGISGDTIIMLRNRLQDDVLYNKPDWLTIKVGINDLHRTLEDSPDAVTPEQFYNTYDEVLSRTKLKLPNCKLLLIEPFYMSREISVNSFRKTVLDFLPEYRRTVHELSKKYETKLIKIHDIFQNLINFNGSDKFCPEPVHPNLTGHMVIAEAVYSSIC